MIHKDIEVVDIDAIKPHPRNPRRGNVEVIAESLKANGQFRPIVVNRRNKTIIAGHHLWQAAQHLGWTEVQVLWVKATENEHRRMMLADNRTSDVGGYDNHELDALIQDLLTDTETLLGTGYTDGDLARLFGREVQSYDDRDPDAVPDTPEEPRTKPGQIWNLGPHRLAVGDATDPEILKQLMNGEKADVMWTDPPYGVDYVGKTKDALKIQNDGAGGLPVLLKAAFATVMDALIPGAPVYVAHADTERIVFETSLAEAGIIVRQNLVWVKNSLVLGRSDYHYKHEPILYGFTPGGTGRNGRGGKRWFGNDSQTTVFEVDRPTSSKEHPTMKPVDLIVQMLRNSAPPGGLVLDIFAGSGSTLVAADSLGLRANVVELDPEYAEVIIARYETLTGVEAVKEEHNPTA